MPPSCALVPPGGFPTLPVHSNIYYESPSTPVKTPRVLHNMLRCPRSLPLHLRELRGTLTLHIHLFQISYMKFICNGNGKGKSGSFAYHFPRSTELMMKGLKNVPTTRKKATITDKVIFSKWSAWTQLLVGFPKPWPIIRGWKSTMNTEQETIRRKPSFTSSQGNS